MSGRPRNMLEIRLWLEVAAQNHARAYGLELAATRRQTGWLSSLCVRHGVDPSDLDGNPEIGVEADPDTLRPVPMLSKRMASRMIDRILEEHDGILRRMAPDA